ncbi:MAG: 50S ribosomal protein L24 [Lentisphaerae bacterium]|nr:50S ribosomal protein L24 [Lentisphaerota bacterium]
MSGLRIRKNDTVIAVAGADAGKSGKVLQVLPARGRVVVEGLRIVKKCLRKTQDNPQGGIGAKEAPLSLCNVMLYCPECKRGVRVRRVKEGDRARRQCRRCGHAFGG